MFHWRGGSGPDRSDESPSAGPEPAPPADHDEGPYDISNPPRRAVPRLDLGSLILPVLPGVEYRFEVSDPDGEHPGAGGEAGGTVVAAVATATTDGSSMRLTVHAAPRGTGLWEQTRAELLRSAPPAAAQPLAPVAPVTREGPFGPEIWTAVPLAPAGPAGPAAPAGPPCRGRLIGVDGPRWLLLAEIILANVHPSAAGIEPEPGARPAPPSAGGGAATLEDVLRAVVVVRGDRAMPVGAPLPLTLPAEPDPPDGDIDDRGDPDAQADEFGRVPPTAFVIGDPRRISYEVVAAPIDGLSRNLSTWG